MNDFDSYFSHLRNISYAGRLYKRFVSSPVLFYFAKRFGSKIIEIGSGTGSGILGAFPRQVIGLEINPEAVKYCQSRGLNAQIIKRDGVFPMSDGVCDVCVLDNVLEHIEDPRITLNECYRITSENGGLVIAVPGRCGYHSDEDHKKFYTANDLTQLDGRWTLQHFFSIPFGIKSENLSRRVIPSM